LDYKRHLEEGMRRIIQLRTGFLALGTAEAFAGILPREYTTNCPVCRSKRKETAEHFILDCPAWKLQRKKISGLTDYVNDHQQRPFIGVNDELEGWERLVGFLGVGMSGEKSKSLKDQRKFLTELAQFLDICLHLRRKRIAHKYRKPPSGGGLCFSRSVNRGSGNVG